MFKSVLACALMATAASVAVAQEDFPTRPITLVVPHPPGGFTDVLARLVSQKLSEDPGWTVIVENRGGGGSTIAENHVAHADPDGYTLMITGRDVNIRSSLYSKLSYDPDKDFAPVSQLVWSPMVLVANPGLEANSLDELIKLAKAQPGKIAYASPGNGSGAHLATEMFSTATDIDLLHVPYKGLGPAATDLLGGQVSLMFLQMAVALPHIESGKLKAIAFPSAERSAQLPDLPTVAESGVPDFDVTPWFGIVAPVDTPRPVVDKISAALAKVMQRPDVVEQMRKQGVQAVGSTPDEFTALIKKETPGWKQVVKDAGVKVD